MQDVQAESPKKKRVKKLVEKQVLKDWKWELEQHHKQALEYEQSQALKKSAYISDLVGDNISSKVEKSVDVTKTENFQNYEIINTCSNQI